MAPSGTTDARAHGSAPMLGRAAGILWMSEAALVLVARTVGGVGDLTGVIACGGATLVGLLLFFFHERVGSVVTQLSTALATFLVAYVAHYDGSRYCLLYYAAACVVAFSSPLAWTVVQSSAMLICTVVAMETQAQRQTPDTIALFAGTLAAVVLVTTALHRRSAALLGRLQESGAHLGDLYAREREARLELERARQELGMLNKRLAIRAATDSLTGLTNRSAFHEHLELALTRARKQGLGLGVVYLDLDGFKAVNDTCGHAAGDRLLEVVARRIASHTRSGDVVARLGGDEFVLLVDKLTPAETEAAILDVVHRLAGTVAEPVSLEQGEVKVSCSIGYAIYPGDGESSEQLLAVADAAMYAAKRR